MRRIRWGIQTVGALPHHHLTPALTYVYPTNGMFLGMRPIQCEETYAGSNSQLWGQFVAGYVGGDGLNGRRFHAAEWLILSCRDTDLPLPVALA